MTQREKYIISLQKNKCYEVYIELCIHLNEVPKELVLTLIKGCNTVDALNEANKLIESKLQ